MGHGDRFRRKALKRGYKVDEVDAFLDRAEATLARRGRGGDVVTASDVRDVVFRTRFGGYDEWQVDLHLDRLEKELEELAAGLPPRGSNGFRALEAGPSAYREAPAGFAERATYDRPTYREEPVTSGYPRDYPTDPGYYRGEPVGAGYPRDYRTDPGYDRGYAGGDDRNGYDRVYGRESQLRREPAEYRVPPGYRPDVPYRDDLGYRDTETTGSGTQLGRAAGLAGAGAAGGASVPAAPATPPPAAGPRDYGRQPRSGSPRASTLFGESFYETLPPARPLEPEGYGPPPGKVDQTVELPPVSGGGGVSPFTNEDKAAVAESRATFRPRRFGSGYDPAQVERLFDAVQATMDGRGTKPMSIDDLVPDQFGLIQGGYFEDDVDGALREVRELFSRRMGV